MTTRSADSARTRRILGLGFCLFVLGFVAGWRCMPKPTLNQPDGNNASPTQIAASRDIESPSAEPRLLSTEPGDFFSRLHVALSTRNSEWRERAFSMIADDLSAAQVQELIANLRERRFPDREEAIAQLFARWAEFDSSAAMVSAQEWPTTGERQRIVRAVLGAWVEKDARAAEQWVTELPEGLLKNAAWRTLIGAVAGGDPPHALALAQSLQLSWEGAETMVAAIIDSWVGSNPHDAVAHATLLPAGELRSAALRRVAEQWAHVDLLQALAWADSVADQEFLVKPMGSVGVTPIFSVLKVWVDKDSAAAVRWLQQLPEGDKKASLISSASTFLRSAAPNPEVATQLAMMLPQGATRDNALQQFAQQIAGWEPAAALRWIEQQSDPEQRRVILSGCLSHLSGSDLQKALEFAQSVDPTGKEDLISIQAQGGRAGWNLADPATLADWAIRQPDNQVYLNRIAASWVSRDADRAAAWLQTLSAPARDEALRGIVDKALFMVPVDSAFDTATHFQTAERWSAQLSSEQARQSAYEKLAERWLSVDPDAARSWVNGAPLPPAVKERLLR